MKERITARSLSLQLGLVAIIGLLSITIFFIFTTYRNQLKKAEYAVLDKLQAVANTLAFQLDGDQHETLINRYNIKDAITEINADSIYLSFHQVLKQAQEKNNIETDVYTLFYGSTGEIDFGVTSGITPYYRHAYTSYPEKLPFIFEGGGTLPPFTDDHGTWLSAVAPIKNSQGKTVAVVEVDQNFTSFIMEARTNAWKNIWVSLLVFAIITVVLVVIGYKLIQLDREKNEKLTKAHQEVKKQNRQIRESINYARRIQQSIITSETALQKELPKSFIFYHAKDIVSGDFPWHYKAGDFLYIAAVDCTGHGVPGAMMSFIGYFLLNEINTADIELTPAEILDRLHEGVRSTLKQDNDAKNARDGMDVALCKLNTKTGELEFAGAHRPLYMVQGGDLIQIKGDRKAIGGRKVKQDDTCFINHEVKLEHNDSIYLFSDGLQDQFGGPANKKYGPSRIRKALLSNAGKTMKEVKEYFEKDFSDWKGDKKQIDDVLMIGLRM